MAGTLFIRRSGSWVPLTTTGNTNIWSIGVAEPTLANTGPSGIYSANPSSLSALTPIQGDVIITTPNTTLINKDIFGYVSIRAANVSLLGCRVRGYSPAQPSGSSPATTSTGLVNTNNLNCINALVQDCYLVPDQVNQYVDAIFAKNYTAIRNTILHCVDGLGIFDTTSANSCKVKAYGNFVDKHYWAFPASGHPNGSHCDGGQHQGSNDVDVSGNRFTGLIDGTLPGFNPATFFTYFTNYGDGLYRANSALQFNESTGLIRTNVQYNKNWLGGGDESVNMYLNDAHFDSFDNNIFDGNNGLGKSWAFATRTGTTFGHTPVGNKFRDGTPVIIKFQA